MSLVYEELFRNLHYLNAPSINVVPPGPRARVLLERQSRLEGKAVLYPLSIPLVPEEGFGATVKDVDGNVYIDFFAGISVANFGYSNPYIVEAALNQLRKIVHTLDFPSEPREELAEKLISIAPEGLRGKCKVLFGGPTGSDAVEASIKLAKWFTKRRVILAFEGSYHGQTSMALNLSSGRIFKDPYIPLAPEVHFLPYPYCYRCPFKLQHPECNIVCVDYVEHLIEDPYSGIPSPAAIIVEPIQGEGGIIVPPLEFLPKLRRISEKYGVPLIIDEIQSGMGRTGKWFACEHSGIDPDIMTVSKAIGGLGLPLSAIMYRENYDVWDPGAHLGTFRGHVLAMKAGIAAIEFAEKNKLLDHVQRIGEEALKYLKDLAEEIKIIGDVRGKGLMIGMEIVKDKESKKPNKEATVEIQIKAFKKGLIIWKAGHYSNVIRLLPPLTITRELMIKGLEILRETLIEAKG
ncbi:MAG: aspartate aminotransferase family protein [Candidatus Methanomethylicia archaeon]